MSKTAFVHHTNRIAGKAFEASVMHAARSSRLLAIKNPLAYKCIGQGKAIAVASELDFTIANARGQVAFIDAKVVSKPSVPKSFFVQHQIVRAYRYNLSRVCSGFIVHFVPEDAVCFISGLQMFTLNRGESFPSNRALHLGSMSSFRLDPIFDCHSNFVATF